jgi:hypothetical protein
VTTGRHKKEVRGAHTALARGMYAYGAVGLIVTILVILVLLRLLGAV